MKAAVAFAAACVGARLTPVWAQDEASADETTGAGEEIAPQKPARAFTQLMNCVRAEGTVEVLKPRAERWTPAEEGRYYPLGSTVRVSGPSPRAEFAFGEKATIVVTNAAEFSTREIALGEQTRTVVLKSGRVCLNLPRTLKEGSFFVAAPFFKAVNLAGESRFDYVAEGDGDEVVVRCVTGSLGVEGRHYRIPSMGAANQIRIRTTGDDLFTSLRGESGDCKVVLDQGLAMEKDFETGDAKDVPRSLTFQLFPQYAVKIFRRKVEVGGNTVVSMMTMDSAGEIKNRCAFAEGRSMINSGELVVATQVQESDDKNAKSAAKDAEEVEAVDAPAEKQDGAGGKKDGQEESDGKEEDSGI
ncbi:MAG: hypothetical protein ACI4Q3_05995 [Kiritimatiellia bacterium]